MTGREYLAMVVNHNFRLCELGTVGPAMQNEHEACLNAVSSLFGTLDCLEKDGAKQNCDDSDDDDCAETCNPTKVSDECRERMVTLGSMSVEALDDTFAALETCSGPYASYGMYAGDEIVPGTGMTGREYLAMVVNHNFRLCELGTVGPAMLDGHGACLNVISTLFSTLDCLEKDGATKPCKDDDAYGCEETCNPKKVSDECRERVLKLRDMSDGEMDEAFDALATCSGPYAEYAVYAGDAPIHPAGWTGRQYFTQSFSRMIDLCELDSKNKPSRSVTSKCLTRFKATWSKCKKEVKKKSTLSCIAAFLDEKVSTTKKKLKKLGSKKGCKWLAKHVKPAIDDIVKVAKKAASKKKNKGKKSSKTKKSRSNFGH